MKSSPQKKVMKYELQQPTHHPVSRLIRDWIQGEHANHGCQKSQELSDIIDAMIETLEEPLPESASAWKRWNDFENDMTRHDSGWYIAMDLCKYTAWCADVDLGLTTEPFDGVPQLVASQA